MTDMLAGGCQCGAVRYTAQPSMPSHIYACHCTECQSQTGSACAVHQWMQPHDLKIEGQLIEGRRTKADGATLSIFGCPNCLSRIYSQNSLRPQLITLRAGTRDDSSTITPEFHMWTRSKQPWIAIPEGALALETQAQSIQEWTKLILTGAL